MNRRTTLASVLAAAPVAAVACALAGCPAAATTQAYTPITGILIRSSALVAGVGCGTGADQVFRYGAFLSYVEDDAGDHGPAAYSGVFDCYSDGLFSNLPADDAGGLSFTLTIVAWNQASFPAALGCDAEVGDASFTTCPGDSPGTLVTDEGKPTWITSCTATQQSGATVLAVCAPLVPAGAAGGDAGDVDGSQSDGGAAATAGQAVVVDTHGFVTGDGGTFVCGADFQTVRATYSSAAQSGTVSAQCPAPLTISPTVAGDAYAIAVELFQADSGAGLAQVACQATASATTPTTAACAPATGP